MGQTTAGKEKRQRERNDQVSAVTSAANQEMQNQLAQGNTMYGGAVSTAANQELVNQGLASVGNHFEQQGGEFIKISKEDYDKKLAAGATNLSTSFQTGSAGSQVLYGGGNPNAGVQQPSDATAMGTGDPTGALTSVPISSDMLQSQNKTKALILGGLSFAAPTIVGTPLRLAAGEAAANFANPEAAHADYMGGFEAAQQGKKYKKKTNVQGIVGEQVNNVVNMLTGKRKKTDGKSSAGGTVLSGNNEEGLGN